MIQQFHFWVYPKAMKSLSLRDICIPVFTAALFTIAKTWKQPKCLWMDEWIKKMWYLQLTLNQHRLQLCRSTYMRIFFNKYILQY